MAAPFDLDRLRLEVAHSLPPQCFDDFQRLSRSLLHGPAFQWLLVDAPDDRLRQQVMVALDKVLSAANLRVNRLNLGRAVADIATLEDRLVKNAGQADVVHVQGPLGWFDAERWDAFNVRRERIAALAKARLVFWLDGAAIALASQGAPDLWAWRGGVYAFAAQLDTASLPPLPDAFVQFAAAGGEFDPRSMAEKHRRVAEIHRWLAAHPGVHDELLVQPYDELGQLLFDLSDYDAALEHWQELELPLHRRRGSDRDAAVTMGQIADILQIRGELDEALRIRRQEQLPVYERLGDVRSQAVTQGRVADILQARGQLDEALRIRQQEELPVYERLGDVRAKAVTLGQVADILQARGQLDEALRIRQEEELPVYEQLGDVRAKAVTLGQVADILQARGQFDEALRIRRQEEIPVYERQGDVRAKAVTMDKIADILQARGQFDEALRIRRQEGLPVYERLGDMYAKAIVEWKIALEQWRRDERAEAEVLFRSAYDALRSMGVPEADGLAAQMHRRGLDADAPHPPDPSA